MGERMALPKRRVAVARMIAAALMLATIALCSVPTPSFAAGRRPSGGPPHPRRGATISGPREDGRVLSVSEGVWLGSTPMSFTYQWEACERGRRHSCTPIPGATEASYRATSQDVRHKLVVLVTAKNAEGTATKLSKATKLIKEGSPLSLAAPDITANPLEGTKLTANNGAWVGTAPFHFSYQWERCSILGGGCETIEGATEASYTPAPADLTKRLAVIVTASNLIGKASATSAETLPVEAVLPTSIRPPKILGLLKEGQLLSLEPGLWEGTLPIAYSYQWQLCNAVGEACENIAKATEPTLKLLASYIGGTLDVVVTAKNSVGESSRTSSPTGLIAGLLPAEISLPSLSGGLLEGGLLKLSPGEWSGTEPISFSYAWELCDAAGKSCEEIEGVAGPTLPLLVGYIGDTVEGVVTAKNVAGEASATSSLSGLIKGIAPLKTGSPSITGGLLEGELLKLSSGEWTGTQPISFSYAWELCDAAGKSCKEIEGVAGPTLPLLVGYIGDTVEGVVTAKNVAGEASATSSLSGLIKGIAPLKTGSPSITGGLLEGEALKLSSGEWTGTQPISFSYAWELCNAAGKSCEEIKGVAGPTLPLLVGYIGDTVEGVVTAKNVAGEASATSSLSGLIKGIAPLKTGSPSITGGLLEGEALKLSSGEWTGSQPISFSYAWQLCSAAGSSCKEIEGVAGPTLPLLVGYIGDTVEGVVTAKNVAGEASATSAVSGLIKGIAPQKSAEPAISGGLVEGDELKASSGKWSGTEPISYTYQWQLCSPAGKSCSEIKGATASALALVTTYIGDTVGVVVTAKNVAGSTSATSAATELIKGIAPANTSLPTIVGTLLDGQLLTAGTGTWSGTEPISYGYQWQLCNVVTKVCSNILGASEKNFKLGLEDVGGLLDVIVTAKNVAGSSSATSSLTGAIGL